MGARNRAHSRRVFVDCASDVAGAHGRRAGGAVDLNAHDPPAVRASYLQGLDLAEGHLSRGLQRLAQHRQRERLGAPGSERGVGVPGASRRVDIGYGLQIGPWRSAELVAVVLGVPIAGAEIERAHRFAGVGHHLSRRGVDSRVRRLRLVVGAQVGLVVRRVVDVPYGVVRPQPGEGIAAGGDGLGLQRRGGPMQGHLGRHHAADVVLDRQDVDGVDPVCSIGVQHQRAAVSVEIGARDLLAFGGGLVHRAQPRRRFKGLDDQHVRQLEPLDPIAAGVDHADGNAPAARVSEQAQAGARRQRPGGTFGLPGSADTNDVARQAIR